MQPEFTAHNIRLDDGTFTKPEVGYSMEAYPWALATSRLLKLAFPGDRSRVRLADLGCLEGGYAVEFARLGFDVTGIEVRESNIAACEFVKSRVDLPNLRFACDDVWKIEKYGVFDAVFCCGVLYHLDRPREFLNLVGANTRRLLVAETHFSKANADAGVNARWGLSEIAENEGFPGRWFQEFHSDESFQQREASRWSSWDNRRSFWLQKEYLLQAMSDAGFDLVFEQFDALSPKIAETMQSEAYDQFSRGTFIGIKSPPA